MISAAIGRSMSRDQCMARSAGGMTRCRTRSCQAWPAMRPRTMTVRLASSVSLKRPVRRMSRACGHCRASAMRHATPIAPRMIVPSLLKATRLVVDWARAGDMGGSVAPLSRIEVAAGLSPAGQETAGSGTPGGMIWASTRRGAAISGAWVRIITSRARIAGSSWRSTTMSTMP